MNELKELQARQGLFDGLNPDESKKLLEGDTPANGEDGGELNEPDESVKTTPFSKHNRELDIFSNHALVQKVSNKITNNFFMWMCRVSL